MVEVVFGESAFGSLQQAQTFGMGKFPGAATAVFPGGHDVSPESRRQALLQAQARVRREWEEAVPLGGSPADVYCIDAGWSMGEISEDGIGNQRRQILTQLLSVWPDTDISALIEEKIRNAQQSFSEICRRSASGDAIRIWYSHNPDELCGLYWLLAQLKQLSHGDIFTVKLPLLAYSGENQIIMRNAWGEIAPGEWGRYLPLQEKVKPVFLTHCAMQWAQLQRENTPLRIFLNGQLQSVPADFYDSFILREIGLQNVQFNEAIVIGNIIGKYQLGIGDGWIAARIQTMIDSGFLEVLEKAPEGHPVYRQILRKR